MIQWQGITRGTMLILSLLESCTGSFCIWPPSKQIELIVAHCVRVQRCHEYLQQPGDIAYSTGQCTVYCALHSRPLGEILLSLAASHLWPISSHLGSGTHGDWCDPGSQSEASIAPADQWEGGLTSPCTDPWCLTLAGPGCRHCWPGVATAEVQAAPPGQAAAQEAQSLFWCPRLSWRWGSEDWIASHLTRPQHFRSIIRPAREIDKIPCEKNSVSGWIQNLMTIAVNFSF